MQTLRVLREPSPDRRVLVIGDEAWPMPIPIVRVGDRWRFATEEGADEIVNRRIGGNERNAIYVLRAYIDAQRAYATRDRDGDDVLQYAQKLASTPGKHDGLYWPADTSKGEEASPFGPLVAGSAAYLKGHAAGDPYRGYYFRILTRQGKSAPGGAYSYVINGRMIAGFAMVAYPAEYGNSGVMTFIVNQNGKVYQRDLGKKSTQVGARHDDVRSRLGMDGGSTLSTSKEDAHETQKSASVFKHCARWSPLRGWLAGRRPRARADSCSTRSAPRTWVSRPPDIRPARRMPRPSSRILPA